MGRLGMLLITSNGLGGLRAVLGGSCWFKKGFGNKPFFILILTFHRVSFSVVEVPFSMELSIQDRIYHPLLSAFFVGLRTRLLLHSLQTLENHYQFRFCLHLHPSRYIAFLSIGRFCKS
jgi:hypothetical protein